METNTNTEENDKQMVSLHEGGADGTPAPADKPVTQAIPDLKKTSPGVEKQSEVVAMETHLGGRMHRQTTKSVGVSFA